VIVIDTNVISELMRGETASSSAGLGGGATRALLYTTHIN
jgi:predicted nucleic acid-binding protein